MICPDAKIRIFVPDAENDVTDDIRFLHGRLFHGVIRNPHYLTVGERLTCLLIGERLAAYDGSVFTISEEEASENFLYWGGENVYRHLQSWLSSEKDLSALNYVVKKKKKKQMKADVPELVKQKKGGFHCFYFFLD